MASSTFVAIPEVGARLLTWTVAPGDGSTREVVYFPTLSTLSDLPFVRGGNPILFPFCARSFVGGEIFCWRDRGQVRPMPLHGFARQSEFRVTALDDTGFTAELIPSPEAEEAYPFDYTFTVRYGFREFGLEVDLELRNHDSVPLPWSAGHHFYLRLPWSRGRKRGDYTVQIPTTKSYRQDAKGHLVPGPEFQRVERLDNPELAVGTMHCGLQSNQVVIAEAPGRSRVIFRTEFGNTSAREEAFTTWTQDDDVPYYCFEPWMGPTNAPETGIGLHQVLPGQSQKFSVSVSLDNV